MNTPRVVMQETKKAFRAIDKRKDIEAAVSALSNLKGVGPAMASGKSHQGQAQNWTQKGGKIYILIKNTNTFSTIFFNTHTLENLYFITVTEG